MYISKAGLNIIIIHRYFYAVWLYITRRLVIIILLAVMLYILTVSLYITFYWPLGYKLLAVRLYFTLR